MAEQHTDQQFLETVIKAIVEHPEDVRSERTVDEMGVLITLHINQADMGQVIGRNGRTARAVLPFRPITWPMSAWLMWSVIKTPISSTVRSDRTSSGCSTIALMTVSRNC